MSSSTLHSLMSSARSRSRATLALATLAATAATACSAPVATQPAAVHAPVEAASELPAPSTPANESEPAASTPASEPASRQQPEAPVMQSDVGVTPTGVPVAVLGTTADGTIVRSPCGNEVVIPTVEPFGQIEVAIDPGHGGPVDTGAVGANGLIESHLNLAVANVFALELEKRGITYALTRTGDYAVPLGVRTDFADATDATIFVSVHHNAPHKERSSLPGTEVFVQGSPQSARLGGLMQESIVAALSQFDVSWVKAPDAGVLRVQQPDGGEAYGLVRRSNVPFALVELGYIANPNEAAFFATSIYPTVAGQALADAAEAYLRSDRLQGFQPEMRTFIAGRSHASIRCTDPPLTR